MDVLKTAEELDHYQAKCQANIFNREAREAYEYTLDTISPKAVKSLQTVAQDIELLDTCEIVILDKTADNGFPHTRPPNLICFPSSMCLETPATKKFRETLIHEAIHVHQRRHTAEWRRALEKRGWIEVPVEIVPAEFNERVRINPDTMLAPFWSWEMYHVPLPLFKKHGTPSLGNTTVQWLDMRTGVLHHEAPASFVKVYGSSVAQPEHPYEIYAELFSARGITTSVSILQALETI
jgi:hypothetical protein